MKSINVSKLKKKKGLIIGILLIVFLASGVIWGERWFQLRQYRQEVAAIELTGVDLKTLEDGIYEGEKTITWISATARVTVENHRITGLEFSHQHDRGEAANVIPGQVMAFQTTQVDLVSGATNSSKVILQAIETALKSPPVTHISKEYQYEGPHRVEVEGRELELVRLPKSVAEEVVVRDFISSVTFDFDEKYKLLADIEPHTVSIENERKLALEEGRYMKAVTLYHVDTLSAKEYNEGLLANGACNDYYYDGVMDLVKQYQLVDFEVINVDYEQVLSDDTGGPQWGTGRYLRNFLVGHRENEDLWKIYDYAMPVNRSGQ
ncbi:FMN-binding protein [Anoxynatronum sibiricum]|uniref:FMN-binding protein n=1 Tax=Anoxynatronum sibiricum TaxID=210623 RepID=A0ABU9VS02_9CLOT